MKHDDYLRGVEDGYAVATFNETCNAEEPLDVQNKKFKAALAEAQMWVKDNKSKLLSLKEGYRNDLQNFACVRPGDEV